MTYSPFQLKSVLFQLGENPWQEKNKNRRLVLQLCLGQF